MKRYQVFTILALIIMTVCFTIPIVGFYGAIDKVRSHQGDEIPAYQHFIWDLYSPFQHENQSAPPGTKGSLAKTLEKRGEVGMASIPVWRISLTAPNYPKETFPNGVPIYAHLDGFSGEVHEMNTINHYIGMYPIEHGAQLEFKYMPFIFLLATLMVIGFLYWDSRKSWILMFLPIFAPVLFMVDYSAWLYWYGHNMQEWGAFTIKPFMPTAFGDGKVAQFTTHSYPDIGFYVLIVMSVLSILAVFSKNRYLKTKQQQG